MSCINVDINLLNKPILCNTFIYSGITVEVNLISNDILNILVNNIYSPIILDISEITATSHLKVNCRMVCSYADMYYLHVSPEEVIWITPTEDILYTVLSNTDWVIKY